MMLWLCLRLTMAALPLQSYCSSCAPGWCHTVSCMQAHSFELEEDTSSYSAYERGGIVTQHKEAKRLAFKPLAAALAKPGEFLVSDFVKLEQPAQLHLGFQALDAYQARALARCAVRSVLAH